MQYCVLTLDPQQSPPSKLQPTLLLISSQSPSPIESWLHVAVVVPLFVVVVGVEDDAVLPPPPPVVVVGAVVTEKIFVLAYLRGP